MEKLELVSDVELVRLDKYISDNMQDLSRTYIQKLIEEKNIMVNSKKTKASYKLNLGDRIELNIPEEEELELVAQDLNLNVLYEDENYAIIRKPRDMVVHPGDGNTDKTLVNGLLHRFESLSDLNGDLRPGIVHRLDKDTSGLLVIAKNNQIHESLSELFQERQVERKYIALVFGVVREDEGTINAPIGRHPVNRKKMAVTEGNSKEAITHYRVLERFNDYTLLELSLETGRTHQIRVHLNYINHPIVGDQVYSNGKNEFKLKTQLLHSYKIGFKHPYTGEYLVYEDEIPVELEKILKTLRNRRDM